MTDEQTTQAVLPPMLQAARSALKHHGDAGLDEEKASLLEQRLDELAQCQEEHIQSAYLLYITYGGRARTRFSELAQNVLGVAADSERGQGVYDALIKISRVMGVGYGWVRP